MSECGSFTRGLPAHAARCSDAGELPSFPSKPDHRPCSRHRKVRHVAREGRCGEERQTAWLSGSSVAAQVDIELSQRGQGRQPRTGEDRRLTGVPACRNRVAEIGSRNRGSEKRGDVPLPEWKAFFAWAGANLEVAISDLRAIARLHETARALRVTGRCFIGPTHSNWWGSPDDSGW